MTSLHRVQQTSVTSLRLWQVMYLLGYLFLPHPHMKRFQLIVWQVRRLREDPDDEGPDDEGKEKRMRVC